MRTVCDAYSGPPAFPHPSCSQLGCCVPATPKPCSCPSAATHKMCRQVCGQGASAAAAQPQCPARPLPRRRVLHYWWRRLTRSNKKARSNKASMSQKHIFMSVGSREGGSRSVWSRRGRIGAPCRRRWRRGVAGCAGCPPSPLLGCQLGSRRAASEPPGRARVM